MLGKIYHSRVNHETLPQLVDTGGTGPLAGLVHDPVVAFLSTLLTNTTIPSKPGMVASSTSAVDPQDLPWSSTAFPLPSKGSRGTILY